MTEERKFAILFAATILAIRLPSDRDAGTYLFGFLTLGNRKNQSCEQ